MAVLESLTGTLLELLTGRIVLLDTVTVAVWMVLALIVVVVLAVRGARGSRMSDPEDSGDSTGYGAVTLIPATTYHPTVHTVTDFVARLCDSGRPFRVIVDTSPDLKDKSERGSLRTRVQGDGVEEALITLTDVHVIPDAV